MIFLFIIGVILAFCAFIVLLGSLDSDDGYNLFAGLLCATILAGFSFASLHTAFNDLNSRRNARHDSVLTQLRSEGFNVPSNRLKLVNSDYYTADIEVNEGGCLWFIHISKYGKIWRPDVALSESPNGQWSYKTLSSRALAKLADVCKTK